MVQLWWNFYGGLTIVCFSYSKNSLRLNNVLVSPQLIKNLISVRQFATDNNCSVEFVSSLPITIVLWSLTLLVVLWRISCPGNWSLDAIAPVRYIRCTFQLLLTPWSPPPPPPFGTVASVVLVAKPSASSLPSSRRVPVMAGLPFVMRVILGAMFASLLVHHHLVHQIILISYTVICGHLQLLVCLDLNIILLFLMIIHTICGLFPFLYASSLTHTPLSLIFSLMCKLSSASQSRQSSATTVRSLTTPTPAHSS